MKGRRPAARYAKTLFALAREHNQTELIGRELSALVTMYESNLDLREFFAEAITSAGDEAGGGRRDLPPIGALEAYGRLPGPPRGASPHKSPERERRELREGPRCRPRAGARQRLTATLAKTLQANQVVLDEVVDPTLLEAFSSRTARSSSTVA